MAEAGGTREEQLRAAISTAVKELRRAAGQVNSGPRSMRYTLKGWMLQIAAKLEEA